MQMNTSSIDHFSICAMLFPHVHVDMIEKNMNPLI